MGPSRKLISNPFFIFCVGLETDVSERQETGGSGMNHDEMGNSGLKSKKIAL